MRKQLVRTVSDLMDRDERTAVLLGDIGVFAFRDVFKKHPGRIYNIGICEQAMAGVAAGLAKEGFIPILHSIAPFVVERCFEQIKVDFCYQGLPVNIVSVGASYDYSSLGCTHHCPADVAALRAIPGLQIVVPGAPAEFDVLFHAAYANGNATYYRLSERSHGEILSVQFGRASVVRKGRAGTIIAVGPNLSNILEAVKDLDVSVLYYTSIAPFDADTLREHCASNSVVIVEPFYEGTLAADVMHALSGRCVRVLSLGVPRRFLTNYGTARDHDEAYGLTPERLRTRIEEFLNVST